MLWVFGPYIEVFHRCRQIIQVYRTHLYGKYRRKLLIATLFDTNGHLLPLTFVVIDKVSADTLG